MKRLFGLLILLFTYFFTYSQISVRELYSENRVNPVGLDTKQPRFTWIMSSEGRNKSQSAYQIRLAFSNPDLRSGEKLIWDTHKVTSNQSTFIPYTGPELESGKRYHWQVRVWDESGKVSKWSSPAFWQMGLLDPEDEFTAQWISPGYEESEQRESPMFRKEFELKDKKIRNAAAYITAHGMYEARINGRRIGDAYFTPGWTSYNKRLQYQVYDVTDLLKSGPNAIGAMLGNGWYRGQLAWGENNKDRYGSDISLLLQLEIVYEDGSKEMVISDNSWTSSTGPVLYSEIYNGEIYDSRKEIQNWTMSGFEGDWTPVKSEDFPKDQLIATYNEPIRKQEHLSPIRIWVTPGKDTVVDFGQNLVGWVQLRVDGQSGQKVELQHAEVLDKEGNFYTENLRDADQKATYYLNGQSQELEPHFTFHGFRYVRVKGFPGELKPENMTAIALYSDMRPSGEFSCSDPLINQLQQNIQWGQKGNFLDIPTDCPQRDERLGWTGDAQAFFRTAAFNRNVNNFFSKWMKDVALDQNEDGSVPYVVPNVLGPASAGSAGWADVATIIPWQAYVLYGDKRMLEQQYPSMKAWVEYIRSRSEDNLWKSGFHFGDWLFYSPDDDRDGMAAITDKYYITQCFYAYSTQLLLNAAKVLGKKQDAELYGRLLQDVKKAYRDEFLSPSGRLGPNTQTAYVLALQFDMLPKELRDEAAKRLVANIKKYKYHLTTGFLGTPYLCHVLSQFGYEDIAYELLLQTTYPSWLYPVTMGATTIWERWDGIKPDSTFQNAFMNSYNHYAYGAIGDWMYRNVAGIRPVESDPGYKQISIHPIPGGGLTEAKGKFQSNYGTIGSEWQIIGNELIQVVSIPVNTTAEIFIPYGSPEKTDEGKKVLNKTKGLEILETGPDFVRVKAGSGDFRFVTRLDPEGDRSPYDEYLGNYDPDQWVPYDVSIILEEGDLFFVFGERKEPLSRKGKDTFVFDSDDTYTLQFGRSRTKAVQSVSIDAGSLQITAIKD